MVIAIFSVIFVIYCFLAAIAYMPSVKNSPYYYWVGLAAALVTNFLWLYLSKETTDPKLINKYAYMWDGVIVVTASLIPIFFFNVRPEGTHLAGIILVLAGMVLLKL